MARARARLPFENRLSQMYLLNSHDTSRFITILDGDKTLLKAAIVMLFGYIGVPGVYYGDKIGLEGGNDRIAGALSLGMRAAGIWIY